MKASDRGFPQIGGHMEVILLITAFASAGAFIGRIVKLNLEEEF
jgi:hypothetical protein